MIKSIKSIFTSLYMPHPLAKFEQYVDKKGAITDYIKCFGVARGLKNYISCRIRRSGQVSVNYSTRGEPCILRSGSADVMVFEQVFIFNDYDIKFETDPEFIIDAGAHIGLASLYFSNRFPRATIICLEPEPENFRLLCRNVEHLPNIKPVNCALWHFSGEIYLDNPNANTWAFRVSEQPSEKAVPTMDIDSILKQYQRSRVNLLKIDIEGSEKALFENEALWTEQIDYLVIETHDHIQSGACEVVEKALAGDMRLIQYQGENRVYARRGLG